MMAKPKKTPAPIRRREEALRILRAAREYAQHGRIFNQRRTVHDMLLDCLHQGCKDYAYRWPKTILNVDPVVGMCLAYVCQTIYRCNDPGSNRLRFKMILKFGGGHSNVTAWRLENAVRICMADLKERRAAHKEGRKPVPIDPREVPNNTVYLVKWEAYRNAIDALRKCETQLGNLIAFDFSTSKTQEEEIVAARAAAQSAIAQSVTLIGEDDA